MNSAVRESLRLSWWRGVATMATEALMTTVSTRKLKDGLSAYLRRAEKGERIVVMRGKRAVAALVPFETAEGLDDRR